MPPEPFILAFDTSAAHCAVALLSGDRILAERVEEMTKGQAERLFPLIEELLSEAGVSWQDITRIGTGIGPGNFTGIRIAVSAARGLALSLKVPAIGVSSFDALAYSLPRPVVASIDARAGRIYLQAFGPIGAGAPVTVDLDAIPVELLSKAKHVVGFHSREIGAKTGAMACEPAQPIAVSIALIAAATDATLTPRPVPLYMRAADAAPPREAPPVILP